MLDSRAFTRPRRAPLDWLPRLVFVLSLILCAVACMGCSAKSGVLSQLAEAEGRAARIRTEAVAADAELRTAEPLIVGTGAEAAVSSARKRQSTISEEARKAVGGLAGARETVDEHLIDRPYFAGWVRWILFPVAGLLGLVLLVSTLGSMGVPWLVDLAAWLARRGFGLGKRLADTIGRAVAGADPADPTTAETAIDRVATTVRSTAFGNAIWKQEQRSRVLERGGVT